VTSDEQAIREVIASWLRASEAGDQATLVALLADDVEFLTVGKAPFGKAEFVASQGKPHRLVAKADVREVVTRGDLGYARTHLEVAVTPRAGDPERRLAGHILTVFRRTPAGRWVLSRDANLLQPVAD
jgi:uncharacterized protein (TIGR02246 family)